MTTRTLYWTGPGTYYPYFDFTGNWTWRMTPGKPICGVTFNNVEHAARVTDAVVDLTLAYRQPHDHMTGNGN